MDTTLSIIVPSLGTHKKLKDLFNSFLLQKTKLSVEILLCLTSTKNDLREHLPQLPNNFTLLIIPSPIPGISIARNLGINQACGSIFLFLDEDCSLKNPNDIDFIVETASANPSQIYAGLYYSPSKLKLASQFYNFMCNAWLYRHRNSIVLGGCCFNKAENKTLKFPEYLPNSAEEYTFCLNAIHQQKTITLLPNWGVWHCPDYSWPDIFNKAWSQGLTLGARTPAHKTPYTPRFIRQIFSQAHFTLPLIVYHAISQTSFFYTSLKENLSIRWRWSSKSLRIKK